MRTRAERLTPLDLLRQPDLAAAAVRIRSAVARAWLALLRRTREPALPRMSEQWLKSHHASTHWTDYDWRDDRS